MVVTWFLTPSPYSFLGEWAGPWWLGTLLLTCLLGPIFCGTHLSVSVSAGTDLCWSLAVMQFCFLLKFKPIVHAYVINFLIVWCHLLIWAWVSHKWTLLVHDAINLTHPIVEIIPSSVFNSRDTIVCFLYTLGNLLLHNVAHKQLLIQERSWSFCGAPRWGFVRVFLPAVLFLVTWFAAMTALWFDSLNACMCHSASLFRLSFLFLVGTFSRPVSCLPALLASLLPN